MAKIVTITNPLTGQPTQVDQLDHTAQHIDDGLNIARGVSNPNLLDNWYFGNPVNQRGQTEYTFDGDYNIYCIDRWRASPGGSGKILKLKLLDGYVEVSLTTPYGRFDQLVENYKQLVGKQVTFTVLFGETVSGDVYLVANQLDAQYSANCSGKKLASVTFTMTGTAGRLYVGIQNNDSSTSVVKPIAAKLELGDQQTLAHQDENGNWVLNEIPDYGEQLARCQRYFQTFATASLRHTDALDFRPVMRTNPALSTITVGGKTLYAASADL